MKVGQHNLYWDEIQTVVFFPWVIDYPRSHSETSGEITRQLKRKVPMK
ncbi:MAG: hypothetical protein CM15mP68_2270 [Pseudomonadota bacterium]|nr:MAG: hypothetical protein CM15mP68_2270 [Pseudomonadota bacterium]